LDDNGAADGAVWGPAKICAPELNSEKCRQKETRRKDLDCAALDMIFTAV
jgi:hypothetical protein